MFDKISSEDLKKIDEYVDGYIKECAPFADQFSKNAFKDYARFWLAIPYITDEYNVIYENFYNIKGEDVYITHDANEDGPFVSLGFKNAETNSSLLVLEPDAFKMDYHNDNEQFKMQIRQVDLDYLKQNIMIYKKESNLDNVIETLSAKANE